MSFDIKIGEQDVSVKFNLKTLFKVNNSLATKDEKNNNQHNGAITLFTKIQERSFEYLVDFIVLFCDKKTNKEDVIDALDLMSESSPEKDVYEEVFNELEDEMVNSKAFFTEIKNYQRNLKMTIPALEKRAKSLKDEDKKLEAEIQYEMMTGIQETLSKKISSKHAQDSE